MRVTLPNDTYEDVICYFGSPSARARAVDPSVAVSPSLYLSRFSAADARHVALHRELWSRVKGIVGEPDRGEDHAGRQQRARVGLRQSRARETRASENAYMYLSLLLDPAQLSRMMSEAMAPAFVLGAVAGFVSILLGRLTAVVDRIRIPNDICKDDRSRAHLKSDLPRPRRRPPGLKLSDNEQPH